MNDARLARDAKQQRVVVLGASPKPERYSNQAVRELLAHGHEVIPVNPAVETIEGLRVVHKLSEIKDPVDTLTLYVSARVSSAQQDDILRLRPKRVIVNPGAENRDLQEALSRDGILVEEACTLVLLRTGQF